MTTTRSVVIEKELPHSPAKIWRALTEGPLIQQWLMDNDLKPVVGHRFQFRATPVPQWDGIVESEVLVVEPNRKIAYRWNSMGLDSTVEWTLDAIDGGTRVRMEHSGFREDQDAAYKGAGYGWQRFFGGLERVIAEMPAGER